MACAILLTIHSEHLVHSHTLVQQVLANAIFQNSSYYYNSVEEAEN